MFDFRHCLVNTSQVKIFTLELKSICPIKVKDYSLVLTCCFPSLQAMGMFLLHLKKIRLAYITLNNHY